MTPPRTNQSPEMLLTAEVARLLLVTEVTVRRLIGHGLPAHRAPGRGRYRFRRSEVLEWFTALPSAAEPGGE